MEKQIAVNGWTQFDYKEFSELLTKANWDNLVQGYNQLAQEIGKRNVLQKESKDELCPACKIVMQDFEYREDGATFKTSYCTGCGKWW